MGVVEESGTSLGERRSCTACAPLPVGEPQHEALGERESDFTEKKNGKERTLSLTHAALSTHPESTRVKKKRLRRREMGWQQRYTCSENMSWK